MDLEQIICEEENVWITLNYHGEDYNVVVTLKHAQELLNDQKKSDQYIEMLLENNPSAEEELAEGVASTSALITENAVQEKMEKIWNSKGRPTQRDEEATLLLLQMREKYKGKFDDKKTIKSQLWQQIAKDLDTAGYLVGEGKIGAERCRQKFSNLQKQYITFIKHMRRTGEEKREPPPHFEKIHGILGGKNKIDPQGLQDTATDDEESHEEDKQPTSANIQNRFSRAKSNNKPKSTNMLLLEEMRKQRSEVLEERKREFSIFERHLEKQNHQRDQLLHILNKMYGQSSRKRRRYENDDSEESE